MCTNDHTHKIVDILYCDDGMTLRCANEPESKRKERQGEVGSERQVSHMRERLNECSLQGRKKKKRSNKERKAKKKFLCRQSNNQQMIARRMSQVATKKEKLSNNVVTRRDDQIGHINLRYEITISRIWEREDAMGRHLWHRHRQKTGMIINKKR